LKKAATGGLLQGPVPPLGHGGCGTAGTKSSGSLKLETMAFLLVASGIKNLYLSDAVALCSNCVVI